MLQIGEHLAGAKNTKPPGVAGTFRILLAEVAARTWCCIYILCDGAAFVTQFNVPLYTPIPLLSTPKTAAMSNQTIKVSLPSMAKMIDHSLLHPTMTDADIQKGLEIARDYKVAACCIKPYSIPHARTVLDGTDVKICAVIGFPHGNSCTAIKVAEAVDAVKQGAPEIDMVVNVGKVLGGDWEYVKNEVQKINEAVVKESGILKVIFENDYLGDKEIIRLCKICSEIGVAFIKTSTGYGFVKQDNGMYSYNGATLPHLKLMREHADPKVQIKAAGAVRTLDDLLNIMALGVTRVGATATVQMLDEAKKRGIGNEMKEVQVK